MENATSQKEITDAIVALGNAKDVLVKIQLESITVDTENAKKDVYKRQVLQMRLIIRP